MISDRAIDRVADHQCIEILNVLWVKATNGPIDRIVRNRGRGGRLKGQNRILASLKFLPPLSTSVEGIYMPPNLRRNLIGLRRGA
eukprot:8681144-Heterocapsa_arctica.AAC.1